VIAVDTDILVAVHRPGYAMHEQAAARVLALAQGSDPWAIPWPCVHEFLAIVTHAEIFERPSAPHEAVAAIQALLRSPGLRLIGEQPDHWERMASLLGGCDVRGSLVHAARIAAICLSHGVTELWTLDRDFSKFPGLKTRNPFADEEVGPTPV
jgi:uncharacterized protein